MRTPLALLALFPFVIACSHTIPIAELSLPAPQRIHGKVVEIDDDAFVLEDATGSIEVEVEGTNAEAAMPQLGDFVTVEGNLDEDDGQEFDAYRIIHTDGTHFNLLSHIGK